MLPVIADHPRSLDTVVPNVECSRRFQTLVIAIEVEFVDESLDISSKGHCAEDH